VSGSVGLDSIYVRDASIVCDRGVVICSMGKPLRETEPVAQAEAYRSLGERILGTIVPPGRVEVAMSPGSIPARSRSAAATARTTSGIAATAADPRPSVELVVVSLPHWRGMNECLPLIRS
jgi:N-dimethylarginine dimethylaminohydrolase